MTATFTYAPLAIWRAVTARALADDQPDLTNRQTAILLALCRDHGAHTLRSLAARLALPKPATCRAIDALERHGLAARVPDPNDRRSVLIEATPAGEQLVADTLRAIAQLI